MDFFKKYWKIGLLFSFIGFVIIPFLVLLGEHFLNFGWFSEADNGAWLGFWGGYLGAILSIGGVYWSLKVQIENNNELFRKQLNEDRRRIRENDRPDFLIQFDVFDVNSVEDFHNVIINNHSRQTDNFLKTNKKLGKHEKLFLSSLKIENTSDKDATNISVELINNSDGIHPFIERVQIPIIRAHNYIYYIPRSTIETSGHNPNVINIWVSTKYENLYYQYHNLESTNYWEVISDEPISDVDYPEDTSLKDSPRKFEAITNIYEKVTIYE
ncbi:hypothetical protein [Lentilactobacillus senioris]|uniref:hypothetical protein n=1 Tax=Lentilactobacillus senioris TaxID=931534 RepID=UPI00070503F0|nr:hypothetical protein [Lentilactobacillus senioris]